jgi:glycerophosphoryl diester phosphodiesterase
MTLRPLVIAHRGGAGEAPENTLVAFRRALDLGVDGVECDVHRSKDGVVVVHHDPELAALPEPAAPRRRIDTLLWTEIQELDLAWTHGPGFSGLKVPSLDQFLALPFRGKQVMVEMKGDGDEEALGRAVARVMSNHPFRTECLFGSFSVRLVAAVHSADAGLRIQAIADNPGRINEFHHLPIEGCALDRRIVTKELVDRLHRDGKQVWSWTVKGPELIEPLLAAGIDALITDCPSLTLARTPRRSMRL